MLTIPAAFCFFRKTAGAFLPAVFLRLKGGGEIDVEFNICHCHDQADKKDSGTKAT